MDNKISQLKEMLDQSKYTVALCGSGMMEEGNALAIKKQERAYEIEEKYGYSSEELFTSAFYNTRPELFFKFYKNEIILRAPKDTGSGPALAAMEKAGKLQCIISSNIYDLSQRAGCKNVINLHGSVYVNYCPPCKRDYPLDYVRNSKRVPICESCSTVIRPGVCLFGEMVDNQVITRAAQEVQKADVLLVLGTNLKTQLCKQLVQYYEGKKLILVKDTPHFADRYADLVVNARVDDTLEKIIKELGE